MSITITEKDLPSSLTAIEAVEAAYSQELAEVASKLVRGLPTLIECDKELAPYLFMNVRDRLRQAELPERIVYAREPQKLPVVLSTEEVVRFLEAVPSLKTRWR